MGSGLSARATPIAVFAYNRPRHTELLLESLARCERLSECAINIYCDGPKTSADDDAVKATRKLVHDWGARHDAVIINRETNVGLARSIVSGVTELCEQYGSVIVVEDDFVLNRSFIDYLLQGLERYRDVENVYQISAYMFPVRHPDKPDAFF